MFDKYKEDMKEINESISSKAYLYKIKYIKILWIASVAIFIVFSLYVFIRYANSVWWCGFFPLVMAGIMSLIFGKGIQWLKKLYEGALLREKQEQKENEKVKETDNKN